MTLEQFRSHVIKMYFRENDPHIREVIDEIWREIPQTNDIKRLPCKVGNRGGYKWNCWIRDDIIPRGEYPWDYDGKVYQRTYALVEDQNGRIIKVKPEKITFDRQEAERWEDLHG